VFNVADHIFSATKFYPLTDKRIKRKEKQIKIQRRKGKHSTFL